MKIIKILFYANLISIIAFTNMCNCKPISKLTYNYGHKDNGEWSQISSNNFSNYTDISIVTCYPNHSEIKFEWAAESGDWVVYDRYSSFGNYFNREIRFAASSNTIKMSKVTSKSKPAIKINGTDLEQYVGLVGEIEIYNRLNVFPYKLPACALKIFAKN